MDIIRKCKQHVWILDSKARKKRNRDVHKKTFSKPAVSSHCQTVAWITENCHTSDPLDDSLQFFGLHRNKNNQDLSRIFLISRPKLQNKRHGHGALRRLLVISKIVIIKPSKKLASSFTGAGPSAKVKCQWKLKRTSVKRKISMKEQSTARRLHAFKKCFQTFFLGTDTHTQCSRGPV